MRCGPAGRAGRARPMRIGRAQRLSRAVTHPPGSILVLVLILADQLAVRVSVTAVVVVAVAVGAVVASSAHGGGADRGGTQADSAVAVPAITSVATAVTA